jgi:antirestriction protein ArdC
MSSLCWKNLIHGLPRNIDNKLYNGRNIAILLANDKPSPIWSTRKQWLDSGRPVLDGRRPVIIWRGVVRNLPVYNHCDVLDSDSFNPIDLTNLINRLIKKTGLVIHDGDQAGYSIKNDVIFLKKEFDYLDESSYHLDVFHEIGHWTAKRVGRIFGERETIEYAYEELVAEIFSCLICSLGSTSTGSNENSKNYIRSWLSLFEHNSSETFLRAFSDARTAVNYVLKFLSGD